MYLKCISLSLFLSEDAYYLSFPLKYNNYFFPILLFEVRQGSGTHPAQYIRLTTAQALAAGILPAIGSHGEQNGQQQHFQLAGNKVALMILNTSFYLYEFLL